MFIHDILSNEMILSNSINMVKLTFLLTFLASTTREAIQRFRYVLRNLQAT